MDSDNRDYGTIRVDLAKAIQHFAAFEENPTIVQIIPADGWYVKYTDPEEGFDFTEPLMCWALRADGLVSGLTLDDDGTQWLVSIDVNFRGYTREEIKRVSA